MQRPAKPCTPVRFRPPPPDNINDLLESPGIYRQFVVIIAFACGILIGIAGAFVGGWISNRFFDRPVSNEFYDGTTWIAAIGGSLVLLILYRLIFGNSRSRR